ncbi:DAK2 domain fusion protein YloV [Fervidobacterium pennivorans DSM 9078]|uniref:DAK2 domain fusion protein YloV n=2 Tax=Fervidobacterium pennivorans TaxID=93466 RepID=H9U9M4_FERPD|nr:DAK2 domain fusion protein YloV [Fervidobacterium pennivorans DSM 9078]
MLTTINGSEMKGIFMKGAENLLAHRDEINALNVFPVPDGDTGSNMSSTMLEACKYLENVTDEKLSNVLDAIKRGTLMGARGNSGVILSQIFRGFCETLSKKSKLTVADFVKGIKGAKETAYKAVLRPVEGTILTVVRVLDEHSKELANLESFEALFEKMEELALDTVKKTPSLLPKLREANVVDAGAKGLYYIIQGFKMYALGDTSINLEGVETRPSEEITIAYEELTYQYCTELIVRTKKPITNGTQKLLENYLNSIGDSVVFFVQDDIIKLHVHTNNPGQVIEEFLKHGELLKVKIDNMKEQHEHVVGEAYAKKERKKIAYVAVSPGEGISKVLKDLGVDEIISGGQSMNPSMADILDAIRRANAENVIVFPNNSNIILAAEQAAKTAEQEGIKVYVVKTTNVQQSISAMIYRVGEEIEEIITSIEEAVKKTIAISITIAVRDSKYAGEKIKKDEYLGFLNKELVAHHKNLVDVLDKIYQKCKLEEHEILTVFVGSSATPIEQSIVEKYTKKKYPNIQIEFIEGGQPHYPFLMMVE